MPIPDCAAERRVFSGLWPCGRRTCESRCYIRSGAVTPIKPKPVPGRCEPPRKSRSLALLISVGRVAGDNPAVAVKAVEVGRQLLRIVAELMRRKLLGCVDDDLRQGDHLAKQRQFGRMREQAQVGVSVDQAQSFLRRPWQDRLDACVAV